MPLSYDFTSCMTIDCPGNAFPNVAPSIAKSRMHQDVIGNYWCPRCAKRCELIAWAEENDWPAARVQGEMIYALIGSSADWYTSIVMASEDMITALYETLIEKKRPQLPQEEVSEGTKRVKAWLAAFDEAVDELERRKEEATYDDE